MFIKINGANNSAPPTKSETSKMTVAEGDVLFVFKESGEVHMSFPEVHSDDVPEHMLCALALSYALADKDFIKTLRDRFLHQNISVNSSRVCNDH